MLYETLKPLKEFLNQALKAGGTSTAPLLEWGNIAFADDASLNELIVLTLVNLAEEKTLKNGRNYSETGGKTLYHNPPWYFNLHLLFSVRFNDYDTSMKHLSFLLQFFQTSELIIYGTAMMEAPRGVVSMATYLICLFVGLFILDPRKSRPQPFQARAYQKSPNRGALPPRALRTTVAYGGVFADVCLTKTFPRIQ